MSRAPGESKICMPQAPCLELNCESLKRRRLCHQPGHVDSISQQGSSSPSSLRDANSKPASFWFFRDMRGSAIENTSKKRGEQL